MLHNFTESTKHEIPWAATQYSIQTKQSPTMTTTTCLRCVSTKRCQLNVPALPRPRTPAESDNRPQTRHQHLHRVLEKRTPDKNQTPHFYKQWRTCEKMYFALDSALTSRANPTMPTTRRLGTHNMCFAAESQLDCLLPTTRFNCCRTAMFKHHPIKPSFGKQSLLPVSVAVHPVAVLHRNRSHHACRYGPSGSPTHVS